MPAATNKAELIDVTEKDYAKLCVVMGKVTPDQAMRKREDDTSIKDVIGHRAHWIALFLRWYQEGQAGVDVHIPAKGYKWNQIKAYNAALRDVQSGITWTQACDQLGANHLKLVYFINSLPSGELYGAPMKGGNNAWTTGRWAEAAGPSHYRSAAKWIRACLRADGLTN
ncbi:ClbS/DfsB family four-helix bundle protein [Octadecabacter sp. 1_MG-2023]|uniref:ClbS/DfsB family four-helix bundle protein n=1 Tax=unclassified Octadecabacter TaxID=196158 RepID=UPI001C0A565D|nr:MULTISPECIES: ClbS/DfsB family four-helix bundle protein [unclassified Octadecabacter]MBU2994692.1 ClbS/DfsB family four-helix bundle protein [Octadecabacter sp. B2R22]MDO6734014.1 ClbS/DfsB family four-helix bundle protein [Octadecabacter sp. 1_MG-2023]